jgi:hypothetical protein
MSTTIGEQRGSTSGPSLAEFGNVVPAGYAYYEKVIVPREDFSHPACRLKWYDIRPADVVITPQQVEEVRSFVKDEIDSGRLRLESELGFVCLHHCGQVLLLLVTTWRQTNEMWESTYMKELKAGAGYVPIEYPNRHRGTYCVWELGAVWHERNAWVRFLNSPRDDAAKRAYLNDRFSGSV